MWQIKRGENSTFTNLLDEPLVQKYYAGQSRQRREVYLLHDEKNNKEVMDTGITMTDDYMIHDQYVNSAQKNEVWTSMKLLNK